MEQRPPEYSALVTVLVLGVLVVVGFLYKFWKNQELTAYESEVGNEDVFAEQQLPSPRKPVAAPGSPEALWEYEVLMGCQLVDSWGNDGSTFRVRHRGQEYVFQLYFADAPETSLTNPDRIREQSRHFNYLSEDRLLAAGREAREFVHKLLQRNGFSVFTRWEKVLQTPRFYGFVHLEATTGERRFLSELLAGRGYAAVNEHGRKLPNGTPEEDFRAHLRDLERSARLSRVGAWRGDGA